ncbi:MAG: M20/M25/M40 family metallo-hydrolase, partial [Pseudomonadota bacterium]
MESASGIDAKADALAFLGDLVAAQSGGEAAVQALIAGRLERAGCEVEEVVYDPGAVPVKGEFAADGARNPEQRRAVVGRLPGRADHASLLLFAHPDGEPATDTSDWQREPFVGTLDGERFYGWGVADDLAGCASAVLALERVASAPGERGSVVFASTP